VAGGGVTVAPPRLYPTIVGRVTVRHSEMHVDEDERLVVVVNLDAPVRRARGHLRDEAPELALGDRGARTGRPVAGVYIGATEEVSATSYTPPPHSQGLRRDTMMNKRKWNGNGTSGLVVRPQKFVRHPRSLSHTHTHEAHRTVADSARVIRTPQD